MEEFSESDIEHLRPIVTDLDRVIPTPRQITMTGIRAIAEKHGLTLGDVMGKSRRRKIITARNEAIRFIWDRKKGAWSSVDIARFFGKDHSTILYAVGRLTNRKPSLWGQKEPQAETGDAAA